ncbi:hypothetical protein KR222_000038, partial [Zaprionus bogoriensis]
GHGTTHEKLGQPHFPLVELTSFKSTTEYKIAKNYSTAPLHPVFNITHFIFDKTLPNISIFPAGYLQIRDEDTLILGPKVEENDWSDLLAYYWLAFLWVIVLLFLIILLPFIAVCYCCFCCCRRCKPGCPPCDRQKDLRMAFICAALLVILMIIIFLGLLIAFTASRAFDHGIDETNRVMRRGGDDTCRFLKDVSDNIYHVFVYNYQELDEHLNEVLNEAAVHILLDLGDASESSAITELERILQNMKEARKLMMEVEKHEQDLRFYAAQLRDGLRGTRRDIIYSCAVLVKNSFCAHFLKTSGIGQIDMSNCLHLEKVSIKRYKSMSMRMTFIYIPSFQMPNTSVYLNGIEKIIEDRLVEIPKKALQRFQEVGNKIEVSMGQVVPPLQRDISRGQSAFRTQAKKLVNIIDAVISDIHFRTVRSTQSFEDISDKYGPDRARVTTIACAAIALILLLLLFALVFGCCFNKNSGAHCLLMAIILIFCVFSFLTLLGLGYYILGVISYQGACSPLRDGDQNAIFRQLDSSIDLNKYFPRDGRDTDEKMPPLRMSKAIQACAADETIFKLLHKNNLYQLEDLNKIKVISDKDDKNEVIFEDDLTKIFFLSPADKVALWEMTQGNLSGYHSVFYVENTCTELSPNLIQFAAKINEIGGNISLDEGTTNEKVYSLKLAKTALQNGARHLTAYNNKYTELIQNIIEGMKKKLAKIDQLILYENRNFSNTIEVLLKAIDRAENFLKSRGNSYVNDLGTNLTDVVTEQMDTFTQGLINECLENVGRCRPLSYIYRRGVDLVCYRLVDPINALWVGLLICALFLLPVLFICHHLMCLWKRLHMY